jgi:hypothetical protein
MGIIRCLDERENADVPHVKRKAWAFPPGAGIPFGSMPGSGIKLGKFSGMNDLSVKMP